MPGGELAGRKTECAAKRGLVRGPRSLDEEGEAWKVETAKRSFPFAVSQPTARL